MDASRFLHSDDRYRRRILLSLVAVLAGLLAVVRFWPLPSPPSEPDLPFSSRAQDQIQIEEVQQTAQSEDLTPPPPAPLPPVVVPNDRIVETDFEWSDGPLPIEDPGEDERLQEGRADEPVASRLPDTNARLLRAVQPSYPEAARQDDVRARVRVSVQVDERGRVTDAAVVDRWRIGSDGQAEPTARLGYGLEEAALTAARRSRFRPAQNDGTAVATQTTLTFTFGD